VSHGTPSIKFRCHQNHTFFKNLDEIEETGSPARKCSMATMASNSDDEGSSHEETSFEAGSWCTKCEAFYRQCKEAAATFGFRLVSSLYSTKVVFACLRSNHRQEV
jgi:hypothetical protein